MMFKQVKTSLHILLDILGHLATPTLMYSTRTAVYTGIHYTGSDIGGTVSLSAPGDGQVRVTCSNAHGLEVGNEVAVAGSAGSNVNGSWIVATVESNHSI